MAYRLIDLQALPQMPWKNGGGTTRQLAIFPPDAGLEDFAWRISCARVASGGPFSRFIGVDRSLALLDGSGLELQRAGASHTLRPGGEVLAFVGEEEVTATLVDGPVTDLNVMTRRDAWQHQLQYLHLQGTQALSDDAEVRFIYCQRGRLQVQLPTMERQELRDGQGLLLENAGGPLRLHSEEGAGLFIAHLQRQGLSS